MHQPLKSKYRKEQSALPPVTVVVQSAVSPRPPTLTAVKIPAYLIQLWQDFTPPPMVWNRIATHKGLLKCIEPIADILVVKTAEEWAANPGSILRPDESQLERLGQY